MNSSMRISAQAAPIRQQTLSKLRQAILEGRFQPNERLYEQKLCELIGVSRTSVREALRQLETEGLVCIIPNRGPIVTKLTPQNALDIYQVREQLEGLAASLFAQRADASMVHALEQSVERLRGCLLKKDVREYLKSKHEFYDILLKGCGNDVVYAILNSLLARITFLRSTSLSRPHRPLESLGEIEKIVAAIKRQDSVGAFEASREHIRNAAALALQKLGEDPDRIKTTREE
ncbi:MAG: GntR family transcriptional regulator [Desulfobacterales bacterium]|jgi:DNA-binding GntR family transcriptional regulator|nr:GntR family transcriptional regulator [Desulfobacterales bacterium]